MWQTLDSISFSFAQHAAHNSNIYTTMEQMNAKHIDGFQALSPPSQRSGVLSTHLLCVSMEYLLCAGRTYIYTQTHTSNQKWVCDDKFSKIPKIPLEMNVKSSEKTKGSERKTWRKMQMNEKKIIRHRRDEDVFGMLKRHFGEWQSKISQLRGHCQAAWNLIDC